MKYKKGIATGALAFSLLVGGPSVYAASSELGIKNAHPTYQKQNKNRKNIKIKKENNIVGTISIINGTGFIVDVTNLKTKTTSSLDVKTDINTIYKKDGISVPFSDLIVGQKVIVMGVTDASADVLIAKTVKIVTKVAINKIKKIN